MHRSLSETTVMLVMFDLQCGMSRRAFRNTTYVSKHTPARAPTHEPINPIILAK